MFWTHVEFFFKMFFRPECGDIISQMDNSLAKIHTTLPKEFHEQFDELVREYKKEIKR